jgi:Holliday junction resolvase RusA-like endonuclease
MILLEIPGDPVPWAAHQGFGKRAYNPRREEKKRAQSYIRSTYKGDIINVPVSTSYFFWFPIPTGTSKKMREKMISGNLQHVKRPDLSNCVKFLEDALKGIIIADDNQVCQLIAHKGYSDNPRSSISILLLPTGHIPFFLPMVKQIL